MAKRLSADEIMRPNKKRPTEQKASVPAPLISLQAFLANFLFTALIQDQQDIFDIVYNRVYARDLDEDANGMKFTFATFKAFVEQQRAMFSNRQLVSQSFVVVPDDAAGVTGIVGHNITLTADQQGQPVTINMVAVVKVIFDEKSGERKVRTESIVSAIS